MFHSCILKIHADTLSFADSELAKAEEKLASRLATLFWMRCRGDSAGLIQIQVEHCQSAQEYLIVCRRNAESLRFCAERLLAIGSPQLRFSFESSGRGDRA
jgi:hypothetical protein